MIVCTLSIHGKYDMFSKIVERIVNYNTVIEPRSVVN